MSTVQVPYYTGVVCPICHTLVPVRVDVEMTPEMVSTISGSGNSQVTVNTQIKGAGFNHACVRSEADGVDEGYVEVDSEAV